MTNKNLSCQVIQNVTLLLAEEMGLIDTIVGKKGVEISLAELSERTGCDGSLIGLFSPKLSTYQRCY